MTRSITFDVLVGDRITVTATDGNTTGVAMLPVSEWAVMGRTAESLINLLSYILSADLIDITTDDSATVHLTPAFIDATNLNGAQVRTACRIFTNGPFEADVIAAMNAGALPLDPEPYLVVEADDARYSFAHIRELGRQDEPSMTYELAEWRPRDGFEQNKDRYKQS